jgi:tetratricopeptide (TPR) repeat protein
MRLIAFVVLLGLSCPVHAQTPDIRAPAREDAASEHFQLGLKFYRAGDYESARVEFETAYRLSPAPDLLNNLSWTAEKQGQIAAALDYARRFVAAARNDLSVAELDQAEGRIVRLQRLQEGQGTTRPEPKQAPQQAPLAPKSAGWRPPAGAIALMAGGGGLLIAGIACGGAALATSANLHSGQAFTLREIDALNTQGQALNGAAIGLDVLGGLSLVGGGVWLVVDWKRSRERAAAGLQPSAGMATALWH